MTTIDVLIRRSVELQQYECVNRNIQNYNYIRRIAPYSSYEN